MQTSQSLGGIAKAKKIYNNYLNNPNICLYCKKPILRRYDKEKLSEIKIKKFCNHSCSAKYFNSLRVKNNYCKICGKKIPIRRKRCDDCLSVYSGNLINKKKSEISIRHIRTNAVNIFRKKYPNIECLFCGYNKFTEICHKKPISYFSNNSLVKEINDINNLMQLCPNCHWEFDHKKIKL